MAHNEKPLLQYYLDANLIEIGDDDKRYEYLEGAAEDLAEFLGENKKHIIPYTSIAVDPEISPEEPRLEKVDIIITKHWKLIRQKYPDAPVPIYRAIIFQALESISKEDETSATIIYLSGFPLFLKLKLPDREKEIQNILFESCREQYQKVSNRIWHTQGDNNSFSRPALQSKKESDSIDELKIDSYESLLSTFERASGPSNKQGQSLQNSNQYWSNQQQHWSHQFAPIAAKGVAEVFDEGVWNIIDHIEKRMSEIEKRQSLALEKIADTIEKQTSSRNLQMQLLWWKDALYSPSLSKSYQDMRALEVTLSLAYDLFQLIPHVGPIGTEYFLREVLKCTSVRDEKISLRDFFEQISKEESLLQNFFPLQSGEGGRTDLVSFLSNNRSFLDKDLKGTLGIQEKSELFLSEICVWLYSSLTANRLASYGS